MEQDIISGVNDRNIKPTPGPMDGWDKLDASADEELEKLNAAIQKAMEAESELNNDKFYGRPIPRGTNLRNRKILSSPVAYAGVKPDRMPDSITARFESVPELNSEKANESAASGDTMRFPARGSDNTKKFRHIDSSAVTIRESNDEKEHTARVKLPKSENPERYRHSEQSDTARVRPVRSSVQEDEPAENFLEITPAGDPKDVKFFFASNKKTALYKLFAQAVIFVATFIVTLIASARNGLLGSSPYTYPIVIFSLTAVFFACVGKDVVIRGISRLLSRKPGTVSVIAIQWVIVLFQSVFGILFSQSAGTGKLYPCVLMFTTLIYSAGWLLKLKKTENGSSVFLGLDNVYELDNIENESLVERVGGGIISGDEKICYFNKIFIPGDYVNKSLCDDPAGRLSVVLGIVSAVIGFIAFLMTFIQGKGFFGAYSAFTGCILSSLPISAAAALGFVMYRESIPLKKKKSGIASFGDADDFAQTKAVVMDATDLYGKANCSINDVNTYNDFAPGDAIAYAAAMFIESHSTIGLLFEEIISGRLDKLPELSEFKYEDRLGFSAVINDEFVVLGTRAMLESHNTRVIPVDEEEKINAEGDKIFYLAVDEKLCATFTVSYTKVMTTAKSIKKLTKRGLTILCRSTDPYLTADFIESQMRLPPNTIKVLPGTAAETYIKDICKPTVSVKARMFYGSNASAMFRLLITAVALSDVSRYARLISGLCTVVSTFIVGIFMCIASRNGVNPGWLVFIQTLETLLTLFVSMAFINIIKNRE